MLFKFDTVSRQHARAALLLYAMYRSRDKNSPLNGLETWDRCNSFIRAACLKSNTTAQFVQEFCKKAKIQSIKPAYLSTGAPVRMSDGSLMDVRGLKDYNLDILEDNTLLKIYETEAVYVCMLVRERIQREKMEGVIDED